MWVSIILCTMERQAAVYARGSLSTSLMQLHVRKPRNDDFVGNKEEVPQGTV